MRQPAQREDVIADSDAALGIAIGWTEYSEGKVLNREIGMTVRVLNPGTKLRVMGFVEQYHDCELGGEKRFFSFWP